MSQPLEPQRQLVLDRVQELGLTLNGVSRAIGRNAAYLHQFVHRKTPRYLPRDTREALAVVLGVREEVLRFPDEPAPPPALMSARTSLARTRTFGIANRPTHLEEAPRDVPLFRETDQIEPAMAREAALRPTHLPAAGPLVAVWITRHSGRLRPGDLAYISLSQPPRPGDIVVVLKDKRIAAIGDLVGLTNGTASVLAESGRDPEDFSRDSVEICKVLAVTLA